MRRIEAIARSIFHDYKEDPDDEIESPEDRAGRGTLAQTLCESLLESITDDDGSVLKFFCTPNAGYIRSRLHEQLHYILARLFWLDKDLDNEAERLRGPRYKIRRSLLPTVIVEQDSESPDVDHDVDYGSDSDLQNDPNNNAVQRKRLLRGLPTAPLPKVDIPTVTLETCFEKPEALYPLTGLEDLLRAASANSDYRLLRALDFHEALAEDQQQSDEWAMNPDDRLLTALDLHKALVEEQPHSDEQALPPTRLPISQKLTPSAPDLSSSSWLTRVPETGLDGDIQLWPCD